MSNKQSSVEWLYNELFPKQLDGFSESEWEIIDKAFEQAKLKHKEEIMQTLNDGKFMVVVPSENKSLEQYYKETFE